MANQDNAQMVVCDDLQLGFHAGGRIHWDKEAWPAGTVSGKVLSAKAEPGASAAPEDVAPGLRSAALAAASNAFASLLSGKIRGVPGFSTSGASVPLSVVARWRML